jgi:predicted nucleic acid-binding protein
VEKAAAIHKLGLGEASTVLLGVQIGADIVLMDERRGRRFAAEQGLSVVGCVGLLEELYRRKELADL